MEKNEHGEKTIYIKLTDSNRIKYESLSEFSDSVFAGVYAKAFHMLRSLLDENKKLISTDKDRDQIYNVIAFLGERGMGKTSAMLSFAATLEKDFSGKNENAKGKAELEKLVGEWECAFLKEQLYFFSLPYIDATMLEKNEGVFDVVLAKMWDQFEQTPYDNRTTRRSEGIKNEVREQFLKVRECYLVQRKINKDILAEEREISTLNTLHKLAGSINLREEFKGLVNKYLKFMATAQNCDTNKQYLVISIDDIDMGVKNAHKLLEEVRRFLMIPQVIILITADWKRLVQICSNYEKNTYSDDRIEEKDRFVNNYLGKVLPHNKRIYMPDFREPDGELKPEYKIKLALLDEAYNEKETIARIYDQYLNIHLDTTPQERHILQNDSLRSLVNYFSDFMETVSANQQRESNEKTRQLLYWMKNDLRYRVAEKIKQEKLRDFWDHLFSVEISALGKEICQYLARLFPRNADRETYTEFCKETSYGYGAIIYGCILLQKSDFSYYTFCEAIILFVTWIQACNMRNECRLKWLEDRSFGNWTGMVDWNADYFKLSSPIPKLNSIPMSKLRLEIKVNSKFENILMEDVAENVKEEKMVGWFEELFYDNLEAIYAFQMLMYAFSGNDTTKLENIMLQIESDWSGGDEAGLVVNPLTKAIDVKDAKDEYVITLYPWNSERKFGWMNFVQNSKIDQFTNSEDWLKSEIAQPIMDEIKDRFMRKHEDEEIPDGCFDVEKLDLIGISNSLISEHYKIWLEKNKDKDILPYDNPQVLYNIGKRLEEQENMTFSSTNGMVISAERYALVIDELRKRYNDDDAWNYAKAFSECPYIETMGDTWPIDDHKEIFDRLFSVTEK